MLKKNVRFPIAGMAALPPVLTLLGILAPPVFADGPITSFTKVYSWNAGVGRPETSISINNNNVVAWGDSFWGTFAGGSTPIWQISWTGPQPGEYDNGGNFPALNSAGQVMISGATYVTGSNTYLFNGTSTLMASGVELSGIMVSNGAATDILYPAYVTSGNTNSPYAVSQAQGLTDSGYVGFTASYGGYHGVYYGNGTVATTVTVANDNGTQFTGNLDNVPSYGGIINNTFNVLGITGTGSSNTVLFRASLAPGGTSEGLYEGNGSTITTIATTAGGFQGFANSLANANNPYFSQGITTGTAMDKKGDVVYRAITSGGNEALYYYNATTGTNTQLIAGGGTFNAIYGVAMNNNGLIALIAGVAGTSMDTLYLYNLNNTAAGLETILSTGDKFDKNIVGAPVVFDVQNAGGFEGQLALNDNNDLAVVVQFENLLGNGANLANLYVLDPAVQVNVTWVATGSSPNGNWSGAQNWSGGISSTGAAPSTAGSVANFTGTGTRAAVSVDAPQTLGTINFSGNVAYTLSGSPLTLDNTGGTGNAAINSTTSSTQTIGAQVVVANTNLDVNSTGGGLLALSGGIDDTAGMVVTLNATAGSTITTGAIIDNGSLVINGAGGNITTGAITGSGLVTLNSALLGGHGTISGAVILGSGANMIYPSAGLPPSSVGTLTVGSLTTNSTTTLQFNLVTPLKTGPNGSDLLVVSGNGGLTLGSGTAIAVNLASNGASTLGYYKIIGYSGTLGGTVSNLTPPAAEDSGNVVYTLSTTQNPGFIDIHRGFLGDVDDSGFVDINDLATLAINWQKTGGWSQGNFLGDPTVDINDLSVLALHWQTGIAAFGQAADSLPGTSQSFQDAVAEVVFGGGAQVPEPASLALLGLGAVGLLVRRRAAGRRAC